ncbi:MAG TPA: ATP phosphoribosyltransferase regulatory subunit [Aquiluna sp.]
MANQVTAPRGMRDFLPAQSTPRQELIAKISASYLSRGFQSIETPLLEDLDRLLSGQGGDNEKLVFKVQKRGEELERAMAKGEELADLGLRFDLTVPLTRYYASNHAKLPRVFKAMQIGPVFRAERPQKGRYRQFMQCDIDIIGDDSVSAEAELVIASLAALQSVGLSGATIRVNHRDLLKSNIEALGIADSDALAAMIVIDKLDKIGIEGVASELGELFGDTVADKASDWLKALDSKEVPELLGPLVEAVGDSAEYLRFDPTLVRGMGYYTGTIFEIEHPDASSSIGGGGRYDGMVGKWLGKDVPAVGISLGFERIADLLGESGSSSQFEVLVYEPQLLATAIRLQSELVAKGRAIRIEKKPKNLKVLLDDMSVAGANQFAILSEEITNIESLEFKPLS